MQIRTFCDFFDAVTKKYRAAADFEIRIVHLPFLNEEERENTTTGMRFT